MAKTKQKARNLDMFKLIDNISLQNRAYYKTLTPEAIKELSAFVVMQWISDTKDIRQLYFLNELVNPFVFSLQKHPELLVSLMMVCTTGRKVKYNYIRKKSSKTPKMPKTLAVVKQFFGYNTNHAEDAIRVLSNDDIVSYAEQLGTPKPDIVIIKKELKTR